MFYFIPAWYVQDTIWTSPDKPWYMPQMRFDDTINQIKMFAKAHEQTGLILLQHMPQLRHFLHEQELDNTTVFSVFDVIQQVSQQKMTVIHYQQLDWPSNVHFVYTPFLVMAYQQERLLAHIELATNGNVLLVKKFKQGQLEHVYHFDDRGFISTVTYYENNQATYKHYLDSQGVWRIQEDLASGQITANPANAHGMKQPVYAHMQDLIHEILVTYFSSWQDTLVISASHQHDQLLMDVLPEHIDYILSFFSARYAQVEQQYDMQLIAKARLLIADTPQLAQQLQVLDKVVEHVPLFDTRLQLGMSQAEKHTIVYWLVDGLDKESLPYCLSVLEQMQKENPLLQLVLASYEHAKKEQLTQLAEQLNGEDLKEEQEPWVFVSMIVQEQDVLSWLAKTRVVIDMQVQPDMFLQIASISAGVPQIHCQTSDYVMHKQNGYIIADMSELSTALDYYLSGLTNWNQSLVYTVQQIETHTSGKIVKRWQQLVSEATNG